MKTLRPLLLIFSALAGGLCAKDESSVPVKPADPARDLVWPEITNAKALIGLAKAATKDDLAGGIHGKQLERVTDPLLNYLHPLHTWADEDFIVIILDTHPFNGQALAVAPKPSALSDTPKSFAWMGDTGVPEIKRILLKLSTDGVESSFAAVDSYVRWKNLTNESADRASPPHPIKIFAPGCPEDLSRAGIEGEAIVTFTVTKTGEVIDVSATAKIQEFAGPAAEAIKLWKFEPGVDLATRLPVETRVSITAVYYAANFSYR